MLVVHHAGKSGDQRGTSKRLDTPETVIKLTKRRDDANDNSESMFTLEFVKGRELYGLAEEPLTLRLSVKDGLAQWSFEHVRNEQKERVREMMNSRMRQRAIAKELNISQQLCVSDCKGDQTRAGQAEKCG